MAKTKLLIADDSKSMQMFYDGHLPDEQFEKRIVGNGQEAVYPDHYGDITVRKGQGLGLCRNRHQGVPRKAV